MADKANQHYVPQFYFRGFSNTGKSICVLNRTSGATIDCAPIKGQASKKYFYGDSGAESEMEKVDGLFSSAIRRLRERPNFEEYSDDDYFLLLQNVVLQKTRTLSARSRSKAMQDRLLQLYMECSINNDETLSQETKDSFTEFSAELEANPKQYQAIEMEVALDCVKSLYDLLPVILHNKTNRPFIFGDAPVVFSNPHLKQVVLRGVLGMQTPGLIIYYPISPQHTVMIIDAETYRIKGLRNSMFAVRELKDIAALNRLQIQNASMAAYFSEFKYAAYVRSLWELERGRLANNQGVVVEAPGVNESREPIGDVFHSFERQLPYIPRLSFFQYSEIPEQEYKFQRRGGA
jgi:Protein of unknown function (DUF4238)